MGLSRLKVYEPRPLRGIQIWDFGGPLVDYLFGGEATILVPRGTSRPPLPCHPLVTFGRRFRVLDLGCFSGRDAICMFCCMGESIYYIFLRRTPVTDITRTLPPSFLCSECHECFFCHEFFFCFFAMSSFSSLTYPPRPPYLSRLHTARREHQREAKESAKRFQVNSTIATKTAEDFKSQSEDRKAAKKESIETAKLNKSAGVIESVHDTRSSIQKMQIDRKSAKKESVRKCFIGAIFVDVLLVCCPVWLNLLC